MKKTLEDEFAIAGLQAIITNADLLQSLIEAANDKEEDPNYYIAVLAYEYARAMIEVRNTNREKTND